MNLIIRMYNASKYKDKIKKIYNTHKGEWRMEDYKKFYHTDKSGIAIEHWKGSISQEIHMHKYYELVVIEKGSCIHMFRNNETILIPGDSFLIDPEQYHGFSIQKQTSIYNCQFYQEAIDQEVYELIKDLEKKRGLELSSGENLRNFQTDINEQGIIHLDSTELSFLLEILSNMEVEQKKQAEYSLMLKKKYLEVILVFYRNRLNQQFKNYDPHLKKNKIIMQTLSYIEEHITEKIDFNQLAQKRGLSCNHFRKLFKDETGLSPVDYINRLRITKACANLHNANLNMSEVAASVGIYDFNYFSRLFKNYMGCSPRQFRTQSKD